MQLIGGRRDGAQVRDVAQDEILAPVERRDRYGRKIFSRIRRVEIYRRGEDGNFHFECNRMMTPDEEAAQGS